MATLDDLVGLGTCVLFPEQVIREFRRNRSDRIDEYITSYKSPPKPITPGFLADAPEANAAVEAHKVFTAAISALQKAADQRKLSAASDPVSVKVEALYAAATKIPTTEEIVAQAEKRMLRGDPPMSIGKRSVGDEIIWESVLAAPADDLILVSRDGTFSKHRAFLAEELKRSTGKSLNVFDKISAAQAKLNRPKPETDRANDAEKDWRPAVPDHLFTGIQCPFCAYPTMGSGGAMNTCGICGKTGDVD